MLGYTDQNAGSQKRCRRSLQLTVRLSGKPIDNRRVGIGGRRYIHRRCQAVDKAGVDGHLSLRDLLPLPGGFPSEETWVSDHWTRISVAEVMTTISQTLGASSTECDAPKGRRWGMN
ncbi:MAG: hypothetical protein R3C56_29035 [Pirellulaceae bacterium]